MLTLKAMHYPIVVYTYDTRAWMDLLLYFETSRLIDEYSSIYLIEMRNHIVKNVVKNNSTQLRDMR